MKPKKPQQQDQADPFRSRLDQILDRKPSLFVLVNRIDWAVFDQKFGRLYADRGRPALPTRLMVELHYLKHAFKESDESVVARLLGKPYWQYFCGFNLKKLLWALLWLVFKELDRFKTLAVPFRLPHRATWELLTRPEMNLNLRSNVA